MQVKILINYYLLYRLIEIKSTQMDLSMTLPLYYPRGALQTFTQPNLTQNNPQHVLSKDLFVVHFQCYTALCNV